MADENTLYGILTCRVGELVAELEKMNRKAARYGCEPLSWVISEKRTEKRYSEITDREIDVDVVDVTMSSIDGPKVGDYQFVAMLELIGDQVMINKVPGEADLPERFRTNAGQCDHCERKRARKQAYIVRDREGNLVQVGRSCLRDFLGTDSPKSIEWRFSQFARFRDINEDGGYGSFGEFTADLRELLTLTACAVRLWGWVPSAARDINTPTIDRVQAVFWSDTPSSKEIKAQIVDALEDRDSDTAQAVIDWVKGADSSSDYINNLQITLAQKVLPSKRWALAASAIAAYDRDLRIRKERESQPISKWIGEAGDKVVTEVKVESFRTFETQFGLSGLYKMVDSEGNKISWFTTTKPLEQGDTANVQFTVKGKNEFKGVKETQVKRLKVIA